MIVSCQSGGDMPRRSLGVPVLILAVGLFLKAQSVSAARKNSDVEGVGPIAGALYPTARAADLKTAGESRRFLASARDTARECCKRGAVTRLHQLAEVEPRQGGVRQHDRNAYGAGNGSRNLGASDLSRRRTHAVTPINWRSSPGAGRSWKAVRLGQELRRTANFAAAVGISGTAAAFSFKVVR